MTNKTILISVLMLCMIFSTYLAIAVDTSPIDYYYIHILKGSVIPENPSIVPTQVIISKTGSAGITIPANVNPATLQEPKKIDTLEDLKAYLTNNEEIPSATEPLLVRNDVLGQMIDSINKEGSVQPFMKIYLQIKENIDKKALVFGSSSSSAIFLNVTATPTPEYSLRINQMNITNLVTFNSFLLNGTNDIFTVSELNQNDREKQINITLVSPKPSPNNGFFLKNISIVQNEKPAKVDLPFRLLKTGQFEIRDNILYSALLNAENLPSTTSAYYYLPQGFVVFPDDNGKIQVNFYRKGTINQPEKETFKDYDFIIRGYSAWISATCSCNCKTLFKDPAAIRTTATEIKEINLGTDGQMYYALGTGQIIDSDLINYIQSYGAEKASFSSSQSPKTKIVFDKNWKFSYQEKTTILKEAPHFKYNGVDIIFATGASYPSTQINLIPKILDPKNPSFIISKIEGKASLKETPPKRISTGKIELKQAATSVDYKPLDIEIAWTHNTENELGAILDTIKQAKQFEKDLKSIEIDIPTPVSPTPSEIKTKTNIKPQSGVKDTCSKYYPAYKCYSFPTDIPLDAAKGKITTNNLKEQIYTFKYPFASLKEPNPQGQQDWECIVSKSCGSNKDQWCCPNGNNVRCCKNPGYKKPCWGAICSSYSAWRNMVSLPPKGDRLLIITYRPETGQPNFYDLDKEYKEAARYDPELKTLEINPQFQDYINANPKAKEYWDNLIGWFDYSGGEKYLKNLIETYCYNPTGTSIVNRYYYYGKTKEPMFCTDALPSPTASKSTPIPKTIEPKYPQPDDTYVYLQFPSTPWTELPPLPKDTKISTSSEIKINSWDNMFKGRTKESWEAMFHTTTGSKANTEILKGVNAEITKDVPFAYIQIPKIIAHSQLIKSEAKYIIRYSSNADLGEVVFDSQGKFFKIIPDPTSLALFRVSQEQIELIKKIRVMITREEFEKIYNGVAGGRNNIIVEKEI